MRSTHARSFPRNPPSRSAAAGVHARSTLRKMPIAFFKIGLAIELMRSTLFRMKMSYMSLRVAIVAAGFVQLIGIGVFFFAMWSRIRPVGSQARESRGERF